VRRGLFTSPCNLNAIKPSALVTPQRDYQGAFLGSTCEQTLSGRLLTPTSAKRAAIAFSVATISSICAPGRDGADVFRC
jgi:hypothetical protein